MSTTVSVAQTVKHSSLSIGLAWRDSSPRRTTAQKVERAAKRFTKLYGFAPSLVYCNPADCDGSTHPSISLKPARSVKPCNFYLCIVSGGAA